MATTIFPREQVIAAYNKAPDAMRTAFNDEKTTELLINLRKILQFEPVLAPILGREVGYLLIGLTTPDKFRQRLVEAHFPEHIVAFISAEITQKILLPIVKEKAKLQSSEPAVGTPQTAPTPAPQAPKASAPLPKVVHMNVPMPSYGAPPLQSPSYIPEERHSPVVVAPLPRSGMPRPAVTITPDMAPAPSAPVAQKAASMTHAVAEQPKELPIGEGEPVAPAPQTPAPVPQVVAPAPQSVPPKVPKSEKEFKTPPVPVRSSTSSDPYREPIEP